VLIGASGRGVRGVARGSSARALRRAFPGVRHAMPTLRGLYRDGRWVFVLGRGGRVRYVGVADPLLVRSGSSLARAVQLAQS
jgi:hypothetical protein